MIMITREKRTRRTAGAVAGAVAAALSLSAAAMAAPSNDGVTRRDLAAVRQATARYHDLDVARAEGYVPLGEAHCVENPGVGAMGSHYYNPTLLFDGVLDPTKPELLVYGPAGSGARLVAVEYMVPVSTWTGTEPPALFGVAFDGPMPEHEPGTSGVHYDLHVWAWGHNPAGMFAAWNPSVTC